jgi:hypothetical protein
MLLDFQTLTQNLVRDQDGKISAAQIDEAISLALREYNKRKPAVTVQDVTGDGTQFLALPAAWETGFSSINSIEYPIGEVPPALLTGWTLYQSPSTVKIALALAIGATASARVNYTIRHVLSEASDTVPEDDREAVCAYAGALLCTQLASLYSGDSDATINADAVNHADKAARYSRRADELRRRFYEQLGIDPKKNIAAGVDVNLDGLDSLGGDRLTHPRRYR